MYPVDKNNSATWKFLAGHGNTVNFTPEENAQHIVGLGANGSYVGINIDGGVNDYVLRFRNELRNQGALFYIQQYPASWKMDEDWDTQALNQREVINNLDVDGVNQQDQYIQWVKNTVQWLQPDICQIMNEVRGDTYPSDWLPSSDTFLNNYVDFCNRFMAELSVAPYNQRVFTVSGLPFFDLRQLATKTFVVPSGCALLYSYHYYYAFDGAYPADLGSQYYWNNNLEAGKTETYRYWLENAGLSALLSQGKKIVFDEQGVNISNPNYKVWMKDAIDFCVLNGMGVSYLDNTGTFCFDSNGNILPPTDATSCASIGGIWWFNHSPAGFWNNFTWELNEIGQTWKQIMDSIAPPPLDLTIPLLVLASTALGLGVSRLI